MVPFMLPFTWLAYAKIPDRLDSEAERRRFPGLPMLRLATLATGVFCIAASGPVTAVNLRIVLILAAVMLVALTFASTATLPTTCSPQTHCRSARRSDWRYGSSLFTA